MIRFLKFFLKKINFYDKLVNYPHIVWFAIKNILFFIKYEVKNKHHRVNKSKYELKSKT